jgi:phosphatidylserine decarboxylase
VVEFAQHIGKRMDEPGSANEASLTGFRNAPTFRVFESDYTPPLCDAAGQGVRTECVEKQQQGVTNKEFENFNQFFCRQLKIPRPIAGENDHKTVVFPADSTFAGAYEITDDAEVDLKGLKWRVADLIQDEELAKKFKGGVWMHCFLNTFDYHRQHAPVSGKVKRAQVIKGAAYLEVVVKKDENTGDNFLDPCRRLDQKDKDAGSVHTVDAPDNPGYQFLQTRGIIVIENEKIGNVAVLPIGMAQVSSVKLHECGHYQLEGQELKKGEEISHFEFGGSDCVLLFEPKARVSNFPNSRSKTHFFYGEKLATSHYDKPVSSRDDFEENYIAVEKN